MKPKSLIKLALCALITLILLTGCTTNEPSLELVNAAVDLSHNQDEEEFVLTYDFVLKNVGADTLGGTDKPNPTTFGFDDGITLTIEPAQRLKKTIEEYSGVNVFSEDANLGMGKSSTPILEPNQEGSYSIYYTLGPAAENPETPSEQVKRIEQEAADATLIVSVEEEEITRFELKDLSN